MAATSEYLVHLIADGVVCNTEGRGKFSIMNYGPNSTLTEADQADLAKLYEFAWTGQLTTINGTPIRFVRPYSTSGQWVPRPW